ncbi:YusW family protein [Jeotgalibacillus aurantiacus]|uniref:YusW family protein n=1 Tax=Jeotgalibacillus aurantiacus TaxID=2763266 RepID=UPI001D09E48A|nr:YusW family protein [Jeotgalibacillus aurantiacus]
MKYTYTLTTIATMTFLLAACGDDETVNNPAPEEEQSGQQSDSGSSQDNTDIPYLEFDIDVDYEGNDNDFETTYDAEGETIKASFEDEQNMMMLSGDDAFQEMQPVLSSFEFTVDTPDEEVINAVIEGFEIEEGFQSIDVEIKFEDGTEKDYEREA